MPPPSPSDSSRSQTPPEAVALDDLNPGDRVIVWLRRGRRLGPLLFAGFFPCGPASRGRPLILQLGEHCPAPVLTTEIARLERVACAGKGVPNP